MPRHKRLEIPGAIYHVIARGIERRDIFTDDKDSKEFVRRLAEGIKEVHCLCYGWALMPNHFHLIIRTGIRPLGDLMRKLLTGYAVYFNRRHKRSGYLYQNRYKSILCQEDVYLLELVRYVHFNPLRSRLVKNLQELISYKWCGHAAIMGEIGNDWQSTDEILQRFGRNNIEARKKYFEFMRDGEKTGKRDDLTGGGLRRSAGGWKGIMNLKKTCERWQGDERMLGDGDFVNHALKISEEAITRKDKLIRAGWSEQRLVQHVCTLLGIKQEELLRKGKNNKISDAKGLIAYWGKRELGLKGTEIGKLLGITKQAVSLLLARGEETVKRNNYNLTS